MVSVSAFHFTELLWYPFGPNRISFCEDFFMLLYSCLSTIVLIAPVTSLDVVSQ
jgi:hypothetical protein